MNKKSHNSKVYSEYKFCLLSNGGWQSVPLSREMKDKYDVNEYEYLLDGKHGVVMCPELNTKALVKLGLKRDGNYQEFSSPLLVQQLHCD